MTAAQPHHVVARRVGAHGHREPRRVGLGVDRVAAPEPLLLHRDAGFGHEVDDHRRVLRHDEPAIDGERDRQRRRRTGRDLDALADPQVPAQLALRLRRPREHDHRHGEHHAEPRAARSAPLGLAPPHRICVASSASGERSPLVRMTCPAIASSLNRSATVVSPLFDASRYG
jgi:hypothetical protein